ncbi:hypothetical protein [Dactylosporangium sp. CA-139066]|uniref:hypothetical protein n=1 Tax=Dactylosporangium sp. CA-139066 TaxID=3239930 RepID=UPI003D8ABA5C
MSHPSLPAAIAVNVIGGAVVLLVLVLVVREARLAASRLRLRFTTIAALRAAPASAGRCLLAGRLHAASPPSPARGGRSVAWYRTVRTRTVIEPGGEWPVTRTLSAHTGPERIALDDGTATAFARPGLVDLDAWRPAVVKHRDEHHGDERTEEWIIPDGTPVVFVGEWARRGDVVELGSSRAWPAEVVAFRRGARQLVVLRGASAGLRALGLTCAGVAMAFVIVAVDLARR